MNHRENKWRCKSGIKSDQRINEREGHIQLEEDLTKESATALPRIPYNWEPKGTEW